MMGGWVDGLVGGLWVHIRTLTPCRPWLPSHWDPSRPLGPNRAATMPPLRLLPLSCPPRAGSSRSGHFLSCLDHYTGAPAETQPPRRFSKPLAAWPVCPPRIALFSFPTDSGALPFPPDRPTCISQFKSFPPSGTPVPSPILQRPVRMLPLPGSRLCLTPASPQTARSSPFSGMLWRTLHLATCPLSSHQLTNII